MDRLALGHALVLSRAQLLLDTWVLMSLWLLSGVLAAGSGPVASPP